MNAAGKTAWLAKGWLGGLPVLVNELAREFAIHDVRQAGILQHARQTGFVWTQRVGVVSLAMNRDYFRQAVNNQHVCVIIAPPSAIDGQPSAGKAVIVSDRAEELYLHLHMTQLNGDPEGQPEVDPTAIIDTTAVIRGRVRIGPGVRIGPRVVITGPAVLHQEARVDACAIIGCDGLYAKNIRGRRMHLLHFGGVEIGENAYIHAGAVVVRSAIFGEATRIGASAHIGILASVGHDADIGEDATLSSHSVIAGRARIGARAWIGASATISNAIHVGDDARIRIGAVVVRTVSDGGDVSGNFAVEHVRTLRNYIKG